MKKIVTMPYVRKFMGTIFKRALHAKQIESICHGVPGILYSRRLSSTAMGRATPLVWHTVRDSNLKRKRNRHECDMLKPLKSLLHSDVNVIVLADRGFADIKFHRFIERDMGWNFIIRMRENVCVTTQDGAFLKVRNGVPRNGRIEVLTGAVVCVKRRDMKEAWSLATSLKG